jgi:hypothetical protein
MSVPPMYIRMCTTLIFNYFWEHMYEPVSRNTLFHTKIYGGFNIVNIEAKITAFHLQHVHKLITSHAKWTYFAVYWIGLSLRQWNAEFADNNRPHTLDFTPPFYVKCMKEYHNCVEKTPKFPFSNATTKVLYQHELTSSSKIPRAVALHPHIIFGRVMSNVHNTFVDVMYRDVSFKIVHNVIATNVRRRGFGQCSYDVCTFRECRVAETVKHLFCECSYVLPMYYIVVPWLGTLSSHTIPYTRNTPPPGLFPG